MNVFDLTAVLTLDTKGFTSALSGAKKAVSIGAKAIGAVTAAVTAFGIASVKTGAEFDKSMSQVAATLGKTMDEMQNEVGTTTYMLNGQIKEFTGNLREFAQEMGSNTAFTATQAADALNYMALAGYDAQTSMDMLPNVLNLAAAGNFDLARASDMVTDTQTAFGISLERTSQLVDEMAKAASTGNTSVEQLGDAFLRVGGLARELNGGFVTLADGTKKPVDGFQEMEIALTAMANAGIKGNEAGTHMRNMLLKLSSPTAAGTKALQQMGITVFDAEGKMRSLSDIFSDLNGQLSEMTQEQKIQTISDLFNTRDLSSAEALLSAVGQDWDKIGESILDAEGAASKMAATQLDNLAGDVTLFKSALEGVQIAISDGLAPAFRGFVQLGTEGLSGIAEALRGGDIEGAFEILADTIAKGLTMIVEGLPKVLNIAGVMLNAIIDAVPTILEGIGAVIPQLAEGLITSLSSLLTSVGQVLPNLIKTLFTGLVPVITGQLPTLVGAVLDLLSGMWEAAREALGVVVDNLPEILDSIIEAIQEALPVLIENAIENTFAILDAIMEAIPILLEKIPEIFDMIVNAINTYLPMIIRTGTTVILHLIQGITDALPQLVAMLPTIISTIINVITQNLPLIIQAGIQILNGLVNGLIQAIPVLVEAIPTIFEAILNAILDNLPTIVEAGIQLFVALIEDLPTIIAKIIEAIPHITGGIINALAKNFPKIVKCGFELFVSLIKNLPEILYRIFEAVGKILTGIVKGFAGGVKDMIKAGANLIKGLWEGIKSVKNWIKEKISGFMGNIVGGIKDFFGIHSPSRLFRDQIGRNLALGLGLGFSDEMKDVTKQMQDSVPTDFDVTPTVNMASLSAVDSADVEKSSRNVATKEGTSVVINVYGAKGQDINELANIISRKLDNQLRRTQEVWA